jgi:membrane protein required for colicin V production
MSIKVFDILLLIALVIGGYKGYKRGVIIEILSTFSFILAFVISLKLLEKIIHLIESWGYDLGTIANYIAFALIFISTSISLIMISKLFKHAIKFTLIGSLDAFLGTLLGIFKWGFFISTFIWLTKTIGLNLPEKYIEDTSLFPIIKAIFPWCLKFLCQSLPSLFRAINKTDLLSIKA